MNKCIICSRETDSEFKVDNENNTFYVVMCKVCSNQIMIINIKNFIELDKNINIDYQVLQRLRGINR